MQFERFFQSNLEGLREAGNYRVFADLARQRGQFPSATRYREDGTEQDVTVWCSNDYLGMGQNKIVVDAMKDAIDRCGASDFTAMMRARPTMRTMMMPSVPAR